MSLVPLDTCEEGPLKLAIISSTLSCLSFLKALTVPHHHRRRQYHTSFLTLSGRYMNSVPPKDHQPLNYVDKK